METLSFGLSRLRPRGVIVLAAGVAVALILCTGCGRRVVINNPPPTVIQNSPPPTATASSREVIVLKEAPPPPRQETMPAQPSGEYIWVAGYWTARDGRQEWVPGRWETPPRSGAVWIEPRWERQGDGYVFIEGRWQ